MKKHILYNLLLLIFFTYNAIAQDNIKFSPLKPSPGETIKFEYNAAHTVLKGKNDIQCVAYLYNDYNWQPADVDLKGSENVWKGSITTPDHCGFIALKFFSGDTIDNNKDQAYVMMMTNADSTQSAGAYAAWGLLRSAQLNYSVPEFIKPVSAVSDTIVYYWLNREMKAHPESKAKLAYPFAIAMNNAKIGDAKEVTNRILEFLLSKQQSTEESLISASRIYSIILQKRTTADSLEKNILTRFPKGNLARLKAYRQLSAEQDFDKFASGFEQFLKDYPKRDEDLRFNLNNRISYDDLYTKLIVIASFSKKDDSYFNKYLNNLSYFGLINVYYKLVDIPNGGNKLRTPQEIYPYDDKLVKRMEQIKDQIPEISWYKSPVEWNVEYERTFVNYVLKTHVNILREVGQYDEGLKYAAHAQKLIQYKSAPYNDDYAFLLKKKGMKAKLHEVLVKSMYENQSTQDMILMLKEEYIAEHQSADGFEKYLNSLKNPTDVKAHQVMIKSALFKKAMPEWEMYDTEGKLIRSKDLKGKIVIMDFWANWCAPCKAAFPEMKALVEKYKDDPKVVFLFVNTLETGDKYKDLATSYIKENNFPFHVVFDNKKANDKSTGVLYHQTSQLNGTSGIPLKAFIDPNGNLRYSTGNDESQSELFDLVSEILDTLKKER